MGHEVEHRDARAAGAEGDEHEAELAHRGVGEHLLDVGLGERHEAGEDGGGETNAGDDEQHAIGDFEDRQHAGGEVDAGDDHGGRVDEGGDRRGAFHGVREPDVEGDLRGLAHGAEEERHAGDEEVGLAVPALFGVVDDLLDVECPGALPQQDDADHETDIAGAGGDERLLGGLGGGALLPIEADEQERADADQFPADEEQEQVVAHDEHEHGGGEELEEGEEPVVARLTLHVADGEDVHHQGDGGDDAEHEDRHRIDEQAEFDVHRTDVAPFGAGGPGAEAVAVAEEVGGDGDHQHPCGAGGGDAKVIAAAGHVPPVEGKHEEHARRDGGEQPCVLGIHLFVKSPSTT